MNIEKVITIKNIYEVFKSKYKFILIFSFSLFLLAILSTFVLPYRYQTYATLLPQQESSGGGMSGLLQSLGGLGAGLGLDIGGSKSSSQSKVFAEILSSRTNSKYIIDKLRLDTISVYKKMTNEDRISFVMSTMAVVVEKSGMVVITTTIPTNYLPNKQNEKFYANLSALITNTALEGLDYHVRTKSTSTARKSKEYIEIEIVKYKIKLDTINQQYLDFQNKNKILDLEEQGKAIVQQAIEVGSELSKAQTELEMVKFQRNANTETVKTLQMQVETLKNRYMAIQRGGLTGDDDFAIALNKIPELTRQYTTIYRDKKILEQVVIYLETQRFQEALQAEKDLPVVEPLDKAIIPERRFSPNRGLVTIVSLFVGFVISLVIVVFKANNNGEFDVKSVIQE